MHQLAACAQQALQVEALAHHDARGLQKCAHSQTNSHGNASQTNSHSSKNGNKRLKRTGKKNEKNEQKKNEQK